AAPWRPSRRPRPTVTASAGSPSTGGAPPTRVRHRAGEAGMRRTPWPRLVAIAAVTAAVALAGLRVAESRGATVLPTPVVSVLVLVGIAAVVLGMGWNVRQYRAGKRPGLDPLVAARTVVLATASAYTGSLLAGWYGAHVVLV